MKDVHHNEAYVIADTDDTSERLSWNAHLRALDVRDGFRRTELKSGDRVIDVGCGPIGALQVLSDLVGPEGIVVGMDMDGAALARARRILDQGGRESVRLVHANINADPPAELRELGPFDAAYCSLFLMHQSDPAATLRRIAGILRPGGYLVAHEFLIGAVPPRSEPELLELDQVWRWIRATSKKRGGSPDVAACLQTVCRHAGLIEVSQRVYGGAGAQNSARRVQAWRETLVAMRPALLQHGVASEAAIDIAVGRLAEAERWEFEALFTDLVVELVARVPPRT